MGLEGEKGEKANVFISTVEGWAVGGESKGAERPPRVRAACC